MRIFLCLFALLAAPSPGNAKVATASPTSFEVEQEIEIGASPAQLWSTLVSPGRWWDPVHSWSGDAANLSLEPRAGGCFCERWAGGSAEHLRVLYAEPGKMLRMNGALGPLQGEGVAGAMTVTLTPTARGTKARLRYVVSGSLPGGLDRVAAAVDRVLGEQFARFKRAAESR